MSGEGGSPTEDAELTAEQLLSVMETPVQGKVLVKVLDRGAAVRLIAGGLDASFDEMIAAIMSDLYAAVKNYCSCGGNGPYEDDECPACLVWRWMVAAMGRDGDE